MVKERIQFNPPSFESWVINFLFQLIASFYFLLEHSGHVSQRVDKSMHAVVVCLQPFSLPDVPSFLIILDQVCDIIYFKVFSCMNAFHFVSY